MDLGFDCNQWGLMARAPDIQTVFTLVIVSDDAKEAHRLAVQQNNRQEAYLNSGWVVVDLMSYGKVRVVVPAERTWKGVPEDKARHSALPKYVNDILDEWPVMLNMDRARSAN